MKAKEPLTKFKVIGLEPKHAQKVMTAHTNDEMILKIREWLRFRGITTYKIEIL